MAGFIKNTRISEIKRKVPEFKKHLSKNEYALLKGLIGHCHSKSLSFRVSLTELKRQLELSVNTIKSCRLSLKEYGLIDYKWETNQVTVYFLRENLFNPEEFRKEKNIKQENKPRLPDYKLDYVEIDMMPTFRVFIKLLWDNGIIMSQAKLKGLYKSYEEISADQDIFKQHLWVEIYHLRVGMVTKKYNLDFVESDLHDTISYYLYESLESGIDISQEELEAMYLRVFFLYDRDEKRVEKYFDSLTRGITRENLTGLKW